MKPAYISIVWLLGAVCALAVGSGMVSKKQIKQFTRLILYAGPSGVAESLSLTGKHNHLDGFANHGGWVNPEDLRAMPQCIAQQDTVAWLDAMTRCTRKICINHFGKICTRHQWLTQLSCLSVEFSPGLVRSYLSWCSRSILAKAQLSSWIRVITGRAWLADVGDTIELQHLSPASLQLGYASIGVTQKAPTCLKTTITIDPRESFDKAIASCSFENMSYHIGNADRPWEYSESLLSMIALDYVSVGYDLTGDQIPYGNYFDKKCFCDRFSAARGEAACSARENLDLTRYGLWITNICGPEFLPTDWAAGSRTTVYDYIPVEDWTWPKCVADMPEQVTERTDRCATNACEVDHEGYCRIRRTIDRSCFCSTIGYNTCGGSCHIFESRINYVHWLYDLCGHVPGWHGLPEDWQRLTVPTNSELLPFDWELKPGSENTGDQSLVFFFKLINLILLNATPFLAIFLSASLSESGSLKTPHSNKAQNLLPKGLRGDYAENRFLVGVSVAAFNVLATILTSIIARATPGLEEISFYELTLLWCSLPRISWLASLLVIVKQPQIDTIAISTTLAIEWLYQALAASTIVQAIQYGIEHDFYLEWTERLGASVAAKFIYAGALMWVTIGVTAVVLIVHSVFESNTAPHDHTDSKQKRSPTKKVNRFMLSFHEQWSHVTKLFRVFNRQWNHFEQLTYRFLTYRGHSLEEERLINNFSRAFNTDYGTLPSSVVVAPPLKTLPVRLYSISIASFVLLWMAQWMFWGGILGLTSDV